MWVRLTVPACLWVGGEMRHYHPGDVVDVGRQGALEMIAQGQAVPLSVDEWKGCGVVAYRSCALPFPSLVSEELTIPWPRTLLWRGGHLPVYLVPVGFRLLETWGMAIPLVAYGRLAAHCGTPQERERTQLLVPDLRVLVYNPDLIFIRDDEQGRAFLSAWKEEEGCPELCLLRAVYRAKPLLLPLPPTWTQSRSFRP